MSTTPRPKPREGFDVVPKLDPLRDMDSIRIGELTQDHLGLQIRIMEPAHVYGRLTGVTHRQYATQIHTMWNGVPTEFRTDPELVIRIEVTQ